MNLIIVESPTKAKTLSSFLGKDYSVEATMGHIKDLPKSKLGVNIENNFEPDYQVLERQGKTISSLISAAKKAKCIYLATDPDREGEAISKHVYEVLNANENLSLSKKVVKRIVFHEITKPAVEEAIAHPREVDSSLVDAQIARRVLDRLVGYKLSPLLWKKVRRGLSAGRVQSVAVRLIVERENEIEKFVPKEYWEIASELAVKNKDVKENKFLAMLIKINDKKAQIHSKEEAEKVVSDLSNSEYIVSDLKKKEIKKSPYPPFTTSTMTQAAARLWGWSAKKTMTIAQRLYENGLITYHRTDSTNIASIALDALRNFINKKFGENYLSFSPRIYKTKSKSAQEAHEAIRPTDVDLQFKNYNFQSSDLKKLYELIWKRFVACQMSECIFNQTTIDVAAGKYLLRTSGAVMKFDGWRKIIPITKDEEFVLPQVDKGEALNLIKVHSKQKFTQPPARYNEASLIKTLESLEIGRPSTYAPIISTIQARNYVEKKEGKFFATPVGKAVNEFLVKNFPDTFEYGFTASMEDNLDKVAEGKLNWRDGIKKFYFPFEKKVKSVEKNGQRVKIETEKLGKACPECGVKNKGELVIRVGRFGKFISCSRFPECKYTAKYVEKIDLECPKCGEGEVIVKKTAKGRTFFGCSRYPDCDWASWKNPIKDEASSV